MSTGTVGGKSGPITLTSGAGSVYDFGNVLASDGGAEGQGKAIDSSASTAWKFKLGDGQTGGFGYIVDLGGKSSLKSLTITTPTSGLQAQIYGTTGTNPPKDVIDSRWKTLSTARAVKSKRSVALKDVAGGSAAYRYVLVYFKTSPASGQINNLQIRR